MNAEEFINVNFARFIEEIKELTLVSAPTLNEDKRTQFPRKRLLNREFDSKIDEAGNLLSIQKGSEKGIIVLSAHIDTVFREDTALQIKESDGKITCPGICDNSSGIVSLMALMEYFQNQKLKFTTAFLFNTGEEELGNLKGIKHFIDGIKKSDLIIHIAIEGQKLGRLSTKFAGSHRRRIIVNGPGGHSWRDYGVPNTIIIASSIIKEISDITLPTNPKTTTNIGTIRGGTSINAIPSETQFTLEVRSENQEYIDEVIKKIDKILSLHKEASYETLGNRPCGKTKNTEIIEKINKIYQQLNIKTTDEISSTDSNYPASLGLPSITLGITFAENTHSINETMQIESIKSGMVALIKVFEEIQH